jgi:hypothetical protein
VQGGTFSQKVPPVHLVTTGKAAFGWPFSKKSPDMCGAHELAMIYLIASPAYNTKRSFTADQLIFESLPNNLLDSNEKTFIAIIKAD